MNNDFFAANQYKLPKVSRPIFAESFCASTPIKSAWHFLPTHIRRAWPCVVINHLLQVCSVQRTTVPIAFASSVMNLRRPLFASCQLSRARPVSYCERFLFCPYDNVLAVSSVASAFFRLSDNLFCRVSYCESFLSTLCLSNFCRCICCERASLIHGI